MNFKSLGDHIYFSKLTILIVLVFATACPQKENQAVKQPVKQTKTLFAKESATQPKVSVLEFDDKTNKIEVRRGQVFKLSSHEFIKINKILEDSRCPVNAMCKWAGRVRVELSLVKESKDLKKFELEFVPGRLDKRLNGFSKLSRFIGIENVKPENGLKKIEESDYLFTFYRSHDGR
jgi:hypothetical protein